MGTRKREIVEFVGLKTYFFPNIALYSECNDELIAKNPEKANPVVSYIFGGTKERPSEQQIIDIILPDNANPETLYTGMDTCLAMGGHYISHFESLVPRLTLLKYTHDLAEVIETGDTKRLHLIGRKARLRKGMAPKLLFMLVKIMMAEDDETKFAHLYDLCEMELEFDAFVFIKLLGLENEKNVNDVEEIREMVMQKITPQLKELMIYGAMDELTRLLITYPIEKSAQKLISHRLDLYKHILYAEQEDGGYPNSDMKKRRLNCQLIFIISRALASGNLHVAKQMLNWIPGSIRKEMFPGLQNNRVEKTLEYLDSIAKIFMNPTAPISFKTWVLVGINEYLNNPWSRRAIVCVLDNFSFAVTHEVFEGILPPMIPNSGRSNDIIVSNMTKSIQCATWIIENYQNYNEKSIGKIQFLNNKMDFVKDVQKALEDSLNNDLSEQMHMEQEEQVEKDYMKSSELVESRSEAVLKTEDFGIVSSPKEYLLKTEDFAITESIESSTDSDDCTEVDDEEETTSEEDELEKKTKFFTEVASKLMKWDKSVNVKKRDWLEENLDQALPKLQFRKEPIAETKKDFLKLQNANGQHVTVNHNNNIEKQRNNTVRTNYTSTTSSSLGSRVGWMEAEKPKSPEFTHHDIISSVSGDVKEDKMLKNTLNYRRGDKRSQSSPPRHPDSLFPSLNKDKCVLEKKNNASPESLQDRITRRREEELQNEIFNSPKLTVHDVLAESGDGEKYKKMESAVPSQQTVKPLHPPYPPVRRPPVLMEELLKLYERPHEKTVPVKLPAPVLRHITNCNRPKQHRPLSWRSVNIKARVIENRKSASKFVDPKSLPRRLFGGVGVGELPIFSGYI